MKTDKGQRSPIESPWILVRISALFTMFFLGGAAESRVQVPGWVWLAAATVTSFVSVHLFNKALRGTT